MSGGPYDYFVELRDGDTPRRPRALWRAGTRGWEYWSTAEWAWRPAGARRRVTGIPAPEVLHPVSAGRAAELQDDRQGWAEYWVQYRPGPDGERVPQSVIRRRISPEGTRCQFAGDSHLWISTRILSDPEEADGRTDWEQIPQAEADAVLERLKGRPGATELGRCGLDDARPGSPFRYFVTGADTDTDTGTDTGTGTDRPTGLWRCDGEDRWEYFSVLEWGWFPEAVAFEPVFIVCGTRMVGEAPDRPEQLDLREIDAARARELEADREAWVQGYWLCWSSYRRHEAGRRPQGIVRRVWGARGGRDEAFPAAGDSWMDTDDLRRFPDYRASDYPWLERTDRAGAAQLLAEVHDVTGVLEY
ncbi:hypothetical protein [Streptomyces sp. NPDC049555]|uniref:hypothetical protein n=1 Tax=Streptomyces sp. NPDC049555 TaxID=3154930 RepID=UPI003436D4F8